MLCLDVINNDRLMFGYINHQFKAYKNHCNKMKKIYQKTDKDLYLLYSLESNMAKYKIFNSLPYLYKNIRILKKTNEENSTYGTYINCFIKSMKNETEIDKIIDLRHKLADFYSFLDDIYLLSDNRHDFEQYKAKCKWNDITLTFETENMKKSFLDGSFHFCDFRFNTQLAIKILKIENNLKNFKLKIKLLNNGIFEIFESIKQLNSSVCDFERFLSDNFVESSFISELKTSCDQVFEYVKGILDYQNGIIHNDLKSFKVPNLFKEIQNDLINLNNLKKIDPKKLRTILLETVEKRMKIDDKPRKMPFLPVFYDLAYEFIEYPKNDNSMAGILKNFDFFNKK